MASAPRTIRLEDGQLSYVRRRGSSAAPFVLVNAMGQPLIYWDRLVDALGAERGTILWELRGTHDGLDRFTVDDQASDVLAVLANEGLRQCHFVGWCTGGKIVLEVLRRQPGVIASVTFLNATFKGGDADDALDTAYEYNLVELCRTIAATPDLAEPLMRLLAGSMGMSGTEGSAPPAIHEDLRPHVLSPFRDRASTVRYAHQVVDFVSRDAVAPLTSAAVPVLVIASEHDMVTSSARARALAAACPTARFVEIGGATHYALYESAGTVAKLLRDHADGAEAAAHAATAVDRAFGRGAWI